MINWVDNNILPAVTEPIDRAFGSIIPGILCEHAARRAGSLYSSDNFEDTVTPTTLITNEVNYNCNFGYIDLYPHGYLEVYSLYHTRSTFRRDALASYAPTLILDCEDEDESLYYEEGDAYVGARGALMDEQLWNDGRGGFFADGRRINSDVIPTESTYQSFSSPEQELEHIESRVDIEDLGVDNPFGETPEQVAGHADRGTRMHNFFQDHIQSEQWEAPRAWSGSETRMRLWDSARKNMKLWHGWLASEANVGHEIRSALNSSTDLDKLDEPDEPNLRGDFQVSVDFVNYDEPKLSGSSADIMIVDAPLCDRDAEDDVEE